MDYIAQPKDYWIAPNAINITRNALGKPNRVQCSVVSGAAILCYIEGVDGLGYDNGHRFRTWPLTISPTYFNSNTEKYVYVAIPRNTSVGTQAVVVFPSEKLDIYGVNANDEQVGSTGYYYIWLQGIITATDGTSNREWQQTIDFGKKGTDEDLYDDTTSDWYQYSKVNGLVTFLKNIRMKAGTTFQNLILGYKELTGVATSDTAYTDSDTLVATPGYVESQYLSKTHESEAQEQIGFLKGLWIGVRNLYEITANGIAKLKSVIAEDVNSQRVQTGEIKSPNYTGDGIADTGFLLTNTYNGHSKLTIDELYVRMKAVFESLEVRERTYTGGDQIWSCAGNRIIRVDYLGNVETADHVPQTMNVHADGRPEGQGQGDVYSVPVPGDTYGYSDVKVPWLLRQMPLLARAKVFARYRKVRIIINEPAGSSANRAAASESPLANIRRARCYFIAKDDDMEVHNWWRINDLARCQTMNLANTTRQTYISGEDEKAGNIFWWRKVIGVSYEPVTLDDGKQYHYFDVSFDYEYEQSHPEVMATSVMEGSDIPAAQDSVVQFGNTIIEGRMNLMMMEVNGGDAVGYNPTTDAPCLKAYRGIYCFDLNKSWVGGNPCKMKLSPKTGYEFYGPNFKMVTEYDVVPVPMDRGLWNDVTPTRDDYREHAMVRKCYYYNKVSHNGSYWLCSIVDGVHWVDGNGDYISDATYSALTEEQKALCSRKQNYTVEEPSEESQDWTKIVAKGDQGDPGAGQPDYIQTQEAWSSAESVASVTTEPTPNGGWSDTTPANTNDYAYLWRRSRKMVLQSDGTYATATGSDGQWKYARLSGTNGTSIDVKGTVATVADLNNITNPQDGDAYVVSANGHLYMWSSEANEWIDLGQFKGDPGVTHYTHAAWASDVTTGTTPPGHTTTGQTTTPNATNVTGFSIAPFAGAAWMGILVNTMASDSNDALAYSWQKVEGQKGDSAVNIVISPASLIVNQDLNNPNNLSDLTQTFVVKVYKGEDEQTVNGISFLSEVATTTPAISYKALFLNGGGQRSGNSNIAGNILTLKQINTYTQGGKIRYYDSMYADVTATYNNNQTITARIRIYANLLGTWKREVEGGVETVVAELTQYLEDENGNIITSQSLREDINDATQDLSELSQTVTTQGQTIQNHNTRLSTAEGNISIVTQKVNNGKNLLTGVLTGSGWSLNGSGIETDDEDKFQILSGYLESSGYNVGEDDGYYTLSYEATSDATISFYVDEVLVTGVPVASGLVNGRRYITFNTKWGDNTYLDGLLKFRFTGVSYIRHPQLETGNEATAFDSGSMEMSSRIKQTAEEIDLSVRHDLGETGINISTHKVAVEAENFTIGKNGTQVFGVDANTGVTTMQDVDIKGSLIFHKTIIDTFSHYIKNYQFYNEQGNPVSDSDSGTITSCKIPYDTIVIGGVERTGSYIDPIEGNVVDEGFRVILPPAKFFVGMRIKIINCTIANAHQASSLSLSRIDIGVVYREDLEEIYTDGDGGNYAFNFIASACPFTVDDTSAQQATRTTFVGAPDPSQINLPNLGSLDKRNYAYMVGDKTTTPVRYRSVELVSQENPYTSSGYAWIIIEAQEG